MDTDPVYTQSELMVAAASREIADGEVVFVGMRLPLLGFLVAKSLRAPNAVGVYELGIIRDTVAPEPILTMGDCRIFTGPSGWRTPGIRCRCSSRGLWMSVSSAAPRWTDSGT